MSTAFYTRTKPEHRVASITGLLLSHYDEIDIDDPESFEDLFGRCASPVFVKKFTKDYYCEIKTRFKRRLPEMLKAKLANQAWDLEQQIAALRECHTVD